MAGPLRRFTLLLTGLRAARTPAGSCRFVSGGTKRWPGQRHLQEDIDEEGFQDVEEVEDKIRALFDSEKKKQRTLKYNILRRQMTPKGAPQRKLTWEAIEQIRHLKQEHPEEWTVQRLAEGYSVSTDVIRRVLRSKFDPAPQRKTKQDTNVMARLLEKPLLSGERMKQDRLKLPGSSASAGPPAVAFLPAGSRGRALISAADKNLMIQGEASRSLTNTPAPVSVTVQPTLFTVRKNATASQQAVEEEDDPRSAQNNPQEELEEEEEEEEEWDGQVFTERQLEVFMHREKPACAVKVGNEFFDAEGNFLYRI